ncbi:unnamed protein product [Haemonchus placei]|uniref:Uncharacterized protein n=1 Tax=Haemonchus placei TaxID=6290 RepID=A0A0N4W1U9_HAEPC|nr:unnamed protein product [Haemonchus placei]
MKLVEKEAHRANSALPVSNIKIRHICSERTRAADLSSLIMASLPRLPFTLAST